MEIVKCVGVKKVYGEGEAQVEALRGIDLTVESGEFLAVAGASGSGKSTLLHILGSVDKATEGEVLVGGTDIGRLSPREAALYRRRKAGLIYQFYNLIPSMTVERNIQMPLLLDKRKPDPAYFRQIVEMLGLEEKLKALPWQLSGGQQQRAAIGRALMARPLLLLADEPTEIWTGEMPGRSWIFSISFTETFTRLFFLSPMMKSWPLRRSASSHWKTGRSSVTER